MKNGFNCFAEKDCDGYVSDLAFDLHAVAHESEYKTIKHDLWQLTKAVISFDWKDSEELDHSKTIAFLKKMVEAAWHCKDNMEREKFTHPSFDAKWTDNPYRQSLKNRDREYKDRNKSSLIHEGKIEYLSVEEVRNFSLAIDLFFDKLGVLNWFALLDKWEYYSKKRDGIVASDWDDHPLCTYEELMKLIEIVFLADNFYYYNLYDDGLIRNLHYFENDYVITKLDAVNTECYNPLEHVNWAFGQYGASELKEAVNYWFECANDSDKVWDRDEPGKLVDFHSFLVSLCEAGWLLTQGDEIPAAWLDPNCFKSFETPKIEGMEAASPHLLSLKKRKNPQKTLSKIFGRAGIRSLCNTLDMVLSYSLQKSSMYGDCKKERLQINEIIEILDAINNRL